MNNGFLYAKDANILQLTYAQYMKLRRQEEETERVMRTRERVLASLQELLHSLGAAGAVEYKLPGEERGSSPVREAPSTGGEEAKRETPPAGEGTGVHSAAEKPVPPLKKNIVAHFSRVDASGRLFDLFKQYYAFLNDACGGMVRVTIKDGICSFWNYDAWEEFAFLDVVDGKLRISVPSRYAAALEGMERAEVPRLLARRRGDLTAVTTAEFRQDLAEIMAGAFREAGVQTQAGK